MRNYIFALFALTACQKTQTIPLPNGDFRDAVSSDFNGDGLADIAAITFVDTLQIFSQQSNGSFSTQTLPTGARSIQLIEGDLENDGDGDLFVVNQDQTINVFNNQTGTFSLQNTLNVRSFNGNTRTVALGDLDGDQDLDIAATTFVETSPTTLDASIVLFFQDAGNFAEVSLDVPFIPFAIAAGDVDGDQDLDLFFDSAGFLQILPNPGDGAFQADEIISANVLFGVPNLLLPVDLDNDGDLDLVSTSFGDIDIFSQDAGTFSLLNHISLDEFSNGTLRNLDLADTNADGRLEIMALLIHENKDNEPTEGEVLLLEIEESSGLQTFEVGIDPVAGFLQDFNGDDTLDLFTVNSQSADISLETDIK